jgi:opacity protein-like surface antigen
MRAWVSGGLVVAVVLLIPGAAAAQEKGQAGVSMEYPATVGVIYHVSDRVAVRPEVSFSKASAETLATTSIGASSSTYKSTHGSWEVGTGVSALFYVARWDALRTYVSPRFVYARGNSTATVPSSPSGSSPSDSSELRDSTFGVAGSFGVQYTLGTKFSVLGEAGVGYSHLKISSNVISTVLSTTDTIGTRGRVGVVFYF